MLCLASLCTAQCGWKGVGVGRSCHVSEHVAGCAHCPCSVRGVNQAERAITVGGRGGLAVIAIKTKQKLSVRVVR